MKAILFLSVAALASPAFAQEISNVKSDTRCIFAAAEALPKVPGLEIMRHEVRKLQRTANSVSMVVLFDVKALGREVRYSYACSGQTGGRPQVFEVSN